jgi:hypothetical protein
MASGTSTTNSTSTSDTAPSAPPLPPPVVVTAYLSRAGSTALNRAAGLKTQNFWRAIARRAGAFPSRLINRLYTGGVMQLRVVAAIAVCAMLGGCTGSLVGDAIDGPEKVAARDDAYCQSIGAAKGTPEYMNCRMTLTQQRSDRTRAALSRSSSTTFCNRSGSMTTCW